MKGTSRLHRWPYVTVLVAAAITAGAMVFEHSRTITSESIVTAELVRGDVFADSLESMLDRMPAESVATRDAVAALYFERLRLGLGSPFRLIDQALRDPMLAPENRRTIGLALLARTLAGEAYEIDPRGLDLIEPEETSHARLGAKHLAIIDSTVASTRDPRVGELTLRLAYRLAAASGAAARRAPEIATAAAAQARDRVVAARDARALVQAAAESGGDIFTVLRLWREARRLQVERPVMLGLSARAERSAVDRLPGLLQQLESIAQLDPAFVQGSASSLVAPPRGDGLARRMAGVAHAREAPPQAPVTVAVTGYAPMIERSGPQPSQRAVRQRFVNYSRNEETLAGEYALLRSRVPWGIPEAALAVLTAGVALRPYAQERAWLAGDDAPTVRDLQTRFGLSISFDRDMPQEWRRYLQRSLAQAITDLRRALPSYDARGLQVHFGESPLKDRALALHDPVKRRIYFPASSSAGVMAHEFVHDLDWLAARRYYGGSGWYRTDRAVRQASDVLAGALRQMASASPADTSRSQASVRGRPTEVFARNVDWFVSAVLASDGRMNGYLSAVQDPVLTGYGLATTPEAAYDGGSATLRALDGMTSLPAAARSWFNEQFGTERRMSVHEVVRRVLEAPLSTSEIRERQSSALWAIEANGALLRSSEVASAWGCMLDGLVDRSTDGAAAREVLLLAANARARGVLRSWAEFARRYPSPGSWRLRVLDGSPWAPELEATVQRDLRDAILWSVVSTEARKWVTGAIGVSSGQQSLPGCGRAR